MSDNSYSHYLPLKYFQTKFHADDRMMNLPANYQLALKLNGFSNGVYGLFSVVQI